jgi:uncharacterized protein (DUF4415 family)
VETTPTESSPPAGREPISEKHIVEKSADELSEMESRTDWEHVDALTDEEIERAVADDPDAQLLDAEWFQMADLIVPTSDKTRVTIRLDTDIVDYFKAQGRGYQTRINDVLKAYVLSQRLKEQREATERGN